MREFRDCLKDFNVSLNEDHIKLVMLHFDYDKDKTVTVSEVMKGIRESLIAWGDNRNSNPMLELNADMDNDNGLGPLPPWITRVKVSNLISCMIILLAPNTSLFIPRQIMGGIITRTTTLKLQAGLTHV